VDAERNHGRNRLDAHAIADKWFGATDNDTPAFPGGATGATLSYVFRTHVSDDSNSFDAVLTSSERFSRPADEEIGRRPRCGEHFGGATCRHFRCCSAAGYCGDSVDYCSEQALVHAVERDIFQSRGLGTIAASATKASITSTPFDSSTDLNLDLDQGQDLRAGIKAQRALPFFCLGWQALTTTIMQSRAIVWVSGLPMHAYQQHWVEHAGGIRLAHLVGPRWGLMRDISADVLQLRLADLRRSMGAVLLGFARARGLRFDEIVRVESWGTRTPTEGIVDAVFTKSTKSSLSSSSSSSSFLPTTTTNIALAAHHRSTAVERVTLSFDFTVKPDREVLPRLVLLNAVQGSGPSSSQSIPRVVFIITAFARKFHLQRLLKQIDALSTRDGGHTTACVAGQTNDPEGISIRAQVAGAATTFDPQVVEIATSDPFNKARNLQACIDTLAPDDIAFVMDVDLMLPKDLSDKARRYTRRGKLVYSPIVWYNPDPNLERTGDVRTDHTRLPLAEKIEWLQLATVGPGIIAFFVGDSQRAGGFDTETFSTHGFEDSEFFFRLKRVGLEFARIVERDLVHIFHAPSANNHIDPARVPWAVRWEKLQRKKCPRLPTDRVLEWYEQSKRVEPSDAFFSPKLPEKDYSYKLNSRPLDQAYTNVGPAYVYSQSICDGEDFCVKMRTHATMQQNKERLDSLCPRGGGGSYKDEDSLSDRHSPEDAVFRRPPPPPANVRMIRFLSWSRLDNDGGIAKALPVASAAVSLAEAARPRFPTDRASPASRQSVSIRHPYVGGYRETGALFRAKIRCGDPFSLTRYGDGELGLLERRSYKEGIDAWSFDPDKDEQATKRIYELIADGFALAEEYDGMHIGLPFYFCTEGTHGPDRNEIKKGGGGNIQWLRRYRPHLRRRIPPRQLVYSWLWANLNYGPVFEEMLVDLEKSGSPCIVVCGASIHETRTAADQLPPWVWSVLTVPDAGMAWFESHMLEIEDSARTLARAVDGFIFVFAAGPISNMLIPLMTRANRRNTYIDVGGSIDWELKGVRTRDFHPREGTPLGGRDTHYVRAGGALTAGQTCTESRWELVLSTRTAADLKMAGDGMAMATVPCKSASAT
jgi:hypothetical protein